MFVEMFLTNKFQMPPSSTTQHQRIVLGKATTSIVNSFIYCHCRTQSCLQSAWHPQLGDQFTNLWGFRRCTGKQTWIQFEIQDAQQGREDSREHHVTRLVHETMSHRNENALIVQLESNNTHTHFCGWTRGISLNDGRFEGGEEELILVYSQNFRESRPLARFGETVGRDKETCMRMTQIAAENYS